MILRRLLNLSNFNFIHIISEPRSGSTQLLKKLSHHRHTDVPPRLWKTIICEPLRPYRKLDLYELCNEFEQNPQHFHVIKNHMCDLVRIPIDLQKRYLALGKNIGLSRRNLFEQTCSTIIAEKSGIWEDNSKKIDHSYSITPTEFNQTLHQCVRYKQLLSDHVHLLDRLIFYEDIVWPNSNDKNLPKQHHIVNLDQLKTWYVDWVQHNQPIIDRLVFPLDPVL